MLRYSKDGISVLTTLDTRRPKKNNLFSIKVQVVYKRVQRYYNTGKELSPEEWDKLPKSKSRKYIDIKESIENSFSLVKNNVETLAEKGGFSFDALNTRLSKGASDTVNTAFRAKISLLKKEERIGSMLFYDNTLKNIELFAGKNISFDSISINWLNNYEKYLLKDKVHTTVGMHMRNIRAIMNIAKKSGAIKETQYPFGKDKYQIQTVEGRKKALTLQEISKVIHYTDGSEVTDKYRDYWFFLYLCNGINVADMVKLKYINLVDGEISFMRQKTLRTNSRLKEIRLIVTPEIKMIIDKWGNEPKLNNYIFPCLLDENDALEVKKKTKDLTKRINKRMKTIGASIGIEGITTYTARHSYATVLKRSGANISYISESLGHSDLKTTESYLASFEKDERIKNAKLLTNFSKRNQDKN